MAFRQDEIAFIVVYRHTRSLLVSDSDCSELYVS